MEIIREILLYLGELQLTTNKDIKKAFINRDNSIIDSTIIDKINTLDDKTIELIKDLL